MELIFCNIVFEKFAYIMILYKVIKLSNIFTNLQLLSSSLLPYGWQSKISSYIAKKTNKLQNPKLVICQQVIHGVKLNILEFYKWRKV
jgi:hypothetical protein